MAAMALPVLAAMALLLAAFTDVHRRIIPDLSVLCVAVTGAMASILEGDLLAVSIIVAALFLTGFVLFALGVMGGGDVKLITAMGFWLTPATIAPFLLVMAITGGMLALGVVLTVTLTARDPAMAIPTVPYGVAIAVSGLFILLGAH